MAKKITIKFDSISYGPVGGVKSMNVVIREGRARRLQAWDCNTNEVFTAGGKDWRISVYTLRDDKVMECMINGQDLDLPRGGELVLTAESFSTATWTQRLSARRAAQEQKERAAAVERREANIQAMWAGIKVPTLFDAYATF